MKIKMLQDVFHAPSNKTLKTGEEYELPVADAQAMIDAGFAVAA